ncbi:MAG: VOC family protein [bacterium]
MKILGMDHLALAVRDLAEAKDFYTRILGGEVVRRIGDTESGKKSGRVPVLFKKPTEF